MELKDVILSTLAEMDDMPLEEMKKAPDKSFEIKEKIEFKTVVEKEVKSEEPKIEETFEIDNIKVDNELKYLNSIRERLLVLFEGFQSPNNSNIEAKIDMTLNFLEYTLATLNSRIDIIEQGNKK